MVIITGEKYFTTAETAQLLDITTLVVRKYCKEGRLKGQKINGNYLISATALRDYAKRKDEKAKC